jgi:hypothetical protein
MIMRKIIIAALVSSGLFGAFAASAVAHNDTAKKPSAGKTAKNPTAGKFVAKDFWAQQQLRSQ